MSFSPEIRALAQRVVSAAIKHKTLVVTAESCTGGLIASALTSISGSSEAVYGGFVTYANDAKMKMLGVMPVTLHAYGAVSAETAVAMARGARAKSGAGLAISVTGIAGPNGGSVDKPVGLVHFGTATATGTGHVEMRFGAIGRDAVREATVLVALEMMLEVLE